MPKHRYNVTEVDYGGGGHRTRLIEINDQLVCPWGAPCPRIYRSKGEGRPALAGRARRSPSPTGSRIPPPFPSWTRREGRGREGGRKGGAVVVLRLTVEWG